jgi:protein-L-isoaspartate(D-aspartate) O-methyltransferase
MILDTYKHKGLRKKLIDELKTKGIVEQTVLDAMMQIPRHVFINKEFEHYAYEDKAFPIDAGQTISQPYTVAFQTSLLEAKLNERILEIGTGSGYQCAVLCALGCKVYTIEYQEALYIWSQKILKKLNYQPEQMHGDGTLGWKLYAPFDKILVTAGALQVPHSLLAQLKIGGFLVIPVGDDTADLQMVKVVRVSETQFERSTHGGTFRFVPFVNS